MLLPRVLLFFCVKKFQIITDLLSCGCGLNDIINKPYHEEEAGSNPSPHFLSSCVIFIGQKSGIGSQTNQTVQHEIVYCLVDYMFTL